MYCKNCGKLIDDDSRFCQYCGMRFSSQNSIRQTTVVEEPVRNKPQADIVSDKWVWSLATIPLVAGWIVPSILLGMGISGGYMSTLIVIILNIVFLSQDIKEIKNSGMNAESWLYLGFILVPVYLFVRESKTNKNYAPGIVWCVLFFLDLIVSL